jgi:hypothetical protein
MAGYIGNQAQIRSGLSATIDELNIIDGVTATTAELNILDGVTSTATELNILDGVTATTAELNIMDGVTATTAELNIMDGVTATTAELNIMDGVTATAAEINLIDGGTARGTTTIVDADGVLVNDDGTMRMTTMATLATYMGTKGLGPSYTRQSGTPPSSPTAGDFWFRSDNSTLYFYDGTDGWLTDNSRSIGSGIFHAANTFSLIVRNNGTISQIRTEPEATMLLDSQTISSNTYDGTGGTSAVSNTSRGVFTNTTSAYAYVTLGTMGAATDFGDTVETLSTRAGCDHATRGIFAGGNGPSNSMEYITIASAGNGTDFGNLSVARTQMGCQAMANTTRGVFPGGTS